MSMVVSTANAMPLNLVDPILDPSAVATRGRLSSLSLDGFVLVDSAWCAYSSTGIWTKTKSEVP